MCRNTNNDFCFFFLGDFSTNNCCALEDFNICFYFSYPNGNKPIYDWTLYLNKNFKDIVKLCHQIRTTISVRENKIVLPKLKP